MTAAAGTATDVVLATMRIGLGLALAYLILSPRGSKGFAGVLAGVTGAVRAIIAPVDPLNPGKVRPHGAAALEVITGAAQEAGPGSPGESGDPVATGASLLAQLTDRGLLHPRANPTGRRRRTTTGRTPGLGLPTVPTFGPPAVTWNTVPPHTATNP